MSCKLTGRSWWRAQGFALTGLALALGLSAACRPARAPAVSGGQGPDKGTNQPLGPLSDSSAKPCVQQQPYNGVGALRPDASYAAEGGYRFPCTAAVPGFLTGGMEGLRPLDESIIESLPSPNYGSRNGTPISGIVVHNTAEGTFSGAISHLRNPSAQVSAHMIVSRQGQIVRLVPDDMSAFHAVQANRSTLGVEIEATAKARSLEPAQERALASLLLHWLIKHRLSASQIQTHRSVVPTLCPGFVWPTESDFAVWQNAIGGLLKIFAR